MITALSIVFLVGYLAIALEHPLRLNKAATALLLGVVAWVIVVQNADTANIAVPEWFQGEHTPAMGNIARRFLVDVEFSHLLGETAGLLFFLLGAMTIVELVDVHEGFSIITNRVSTTNQRSLLWIVGWLTFFMSSVLDNLTTTIVMVSLLRKIVREPTLRRYFVGLVVIAANAGGAWTPIGDVTTTMLWMSGKYTPLQVMSGLIVPSIVCLLVPLVLLSFVLKGALPSREEDTPTRNMPRGRRWLFLGLGVFGLLSVPVFKAFTHLPPFMGMMASLAALWVVSEVINHHADEEWKSSTGVVAVLKRVDMSSILFFLGILLAVGALGAGGVLSRLAGGLDHALGNTTLVAVVVGLISAIVDNVPLVAAGIGMYDFPSGHRFWLELAYCAGTGGSCLIIGSAAGVAAMGLENIDFVWYLKRIAPVALAGYLAGIGVYLVGAAGLP